MSFTVYFVQTGHAEAGRALRQHLVKQYECCRLSDQTHLIATGESPGDVAKGLVGVSGKPRLVKDKVTGVASLDWTLLVAALAGPRAGTLGKTAAEWVFRQFYIAPRVAGSGVFVAHWDASGPPWDRRDRPDTYFRDRFRDWIYPSFNTFVLRTRLKADALHAGIRNKWRGARRKPNGREMAFVAELAGPYAAYLRPAMNEWLEKKLEAGAPTPNPEPKARGIAWSEGGGWFQSQKPVHFPVFRQSIRIMVYTEGERAAQPGVLTPAHLAAIDGLLAVPPKRRREWSAAVFDDFRRAINSRQCELRSQDVLKRCRKPEDVWPLVKWSEVVVPEQGPKGDRFILVHGHPDWRIEHGLQLLFKNEQLLWVGRADEMLFDGDWSRDYLPPGYRRKRR